MTRPRLFVISGPSGAGKGTVVAGLRERRPDIRLSISFTTRTPRPMEKNGVHYNFVSPRQFMGMRERGEFLEWAEVHGNLYGTLRRSVEEPLARGDDALLEIDVQGALQVKRHMPDAALIFIEAPSIRVLEQRLRKRSTEREEEVGRRMAAAYDELRSKGWFDGVVINDEVDRAVQEVLQLMDELKEK